MPFFSFIIPTYNRAQILPATINSILEQDFDSLEVIIVDDGSTDGTFDEIQKIKDERIKYSKISNSERGAARNIGLKMASGIYVNYFDSDDLLLPCLKSLSEFIKEKSPSILYGYIEHVDSFGQIFRVKKPKDRYFNQELLKNNFLACGSVFLKKEVADIFPFNEDRRLSSAEDWDLWLRIRVRFYFTQYPFPIFRQIYHSQRSLETIQPKRVEERDVFFISLIRNNANIIEYYGASAINLFVADRYTFIALTWLDQNKVMAYDYWKKAIATSHKVLIRKRFWAILKKLKTS